MTINPDNLLNKEKQHKYPKKWARISENNLWLEVIYDMRTIEMNCYFLPASGAEQCLWGLLLCVLSIFRIAGLTKEKSEDEIFFVPQVDQHWRCFEHCVG